MNVAVQIPSGAPRECAPPAIRPATARHWHSHNAIQASLVPHMDDVASGRQAIKTDPVLDQIEVGFRFVAFTPGESHIHTWLSTGGLIGRIRNKIRMYCGRPESRVC